MTNKTEALHLKSAGGSGELMSALDQFLQFVSGKISAEDFLASPAGRIARERCWLGGKSRRRFKPAFHENTKRCPGCGKAITYIDGKLLTIHCSSCHKNWHHACEECGACMAEWRVIDSGRERGNRRDRKYCSNRCRQKAYRKRRKLDG